MPRIFFKPTLIILMINYSCQSTLIYTRAHQPKIELSAPGDHIFFLSRTGDITGEEGRKAARSYPEAYDVFINNLDLGFRNRLYITLVPPDTNRAIKNLSGKKIPVTPEN